MTEKNLVLDIAYDNKYHCLVLHNKNNDKVIIVNNGNWIDVIANDEIIDYLEINRDEIFNFQEAIGLYDEGDSPEQQEAIMYADIFSFQNIQLDSVHINHDDFDCAYDSDCILVEFNNCILNGITYSQYSPSISVENCIIRGVDLDSEACTICVDESSEVIDELITENETAFEKANKKQPRIIEKL